MPTEGPDRSARDRSARAQTHLDELRERLAGELQPVHPIRPWRSSLLAVALGFGVGLGILWPLMGLRSDASQLGPVWLWGPVVLSVAIGAALIRLAVRRAIPGNLPPTSLLILGPILGLGLCLMLYGAVYSKSRVAAPPEDAWTIGLVCFSMELCLGVPVVVLLLLSARRGLVANPILPAAAGATGIALVTDSVWRLICQYSEPSHVAMAHAPGMIAVILLGALVAYLWDRRRLGRPPD